MANASLAVNILNIMIFLSDTKHVKLIIYICYFSDIILWIHIHQTPQLDNLSVE